jgi:hypothetical protein
VIIYKLWQARFTEAWYQLSQETQQQLLYRVSLALKEVGGKELKMCTASWSNAEWPFFGLEEYPDLEAVQRHEQLLTDLQWSRYNDSRITLGTEFTLPE